MMIKYGVLIDNLANGTLSLLTQTFDTKQEASDFADIYSETTNGHVCTPVKLTIESVYAPCNVPD